MSEVAETDRSKYDHWRALSDEWLASGEAQKQFCERKQINYNHFVFWRSKFLQENGKSRIQLAQVKLKQSTIVSAPSSDLIKLVLPNGVAVYVPPLMPQATIEAVIMSAVQSC